MRFRGLLVSLLMLASQAATAHPLAPAMLELREQVPDQYEVLWRTSTTRAGRNDVLPQLPRECARIGEAREGLEQDAWVSRWTVQCAGGLTGRSIGVSGLAQSRITVILRLQRVDQPSLQTVLDLRSPQFSVPEPAQVPPVFGAYFGLGVEHLLLGFDHVLFVAGLVLLVRRMKPLLITITAFTVGHSITLSLASLGLVRVNAALMELGIAISILVLACEVARPQPGLFARRPWLMAGGFGLLHGLGFAGALAEIGLPQGEIPLALLAFNLGIEAGQVLLVALLLLLGLLWKRLPPAASSTVPASYLIGTLAAYWCFERAVAVLG